MKPTLLLAIIGVAIAGFFGYHTIYLRQEEQVRLIQTQLDEEHANQKAQADVGALLREIEQYSNRLPPKPEPSWLVDEAVALADQAGVQLTTLTQHAPKPLQQFTRLSVTLQLRASYHQLGTFLDRLEHADHYVRVDSLAITPPQEKSALATIRLVLSTVYLPPVRAVTGS